MKLQFDPKLEHQKQALDSIVEIFRGQKPRQFDYTFQVVPNVLTLSKDEILENLNNVRKINNIPALEKLELASVEHLNGTLNFTIEMETGTGKTYIYLRTILELHQRCGFTKFIIVVPSVAIKEGVLKTLEITKDHFRQIYDNLPYTHFTYESENLAQIRMFAQDTNLQIMIITRDAFNKDTNIIHNVQDKMGDKPIELIKQTRPIVILDEPQKIGGEASQWGISELNPLFILRYSATHREVYNLAYRLTPSDAYKSGLVKKIDVLSITEKSDPSTKKVILEKIDEKLRANVKVFVKEKDGTKIKFKKLKSGDDLAQITDNPYYDGFLVSEINRGAGYILFANGLKIYEGKSSAEDDAIYRTMIRETVKEHLETKRKMNPKGIKVLSLFFINRVDDYLPADGWLRKMFEEEFQKQIAGFQDFSKLDAGKIHNGYFSKMSKTSSIENDKDAYDLIMKDKERLLSLTEPVEFIFSHSALREGWDNPNVFNICTLSYSTSEIKKRQEIGRGLRLCVNSNGERIQDREINRLTVITNESYREYVEQLQTEFKDEVGEDAPPIENKRERRKMILKKGALKTPEFESLWNRISKKAKFVINVNENELVEKCVKAMAEIEGIRKPEISAQKIRLEEIGSEKIKDNFVWERSEKSRVNGILNAVKHIENETHITRTTIFKILSKASNLNMLFDNPQKYAEAATAKISSALKEISVDNLNYVEMGDPFNSSSFESEISTYDKYIIPLENQKTIYRIDGQDKDGVIISTGPSEEGISKIEKEFAENLDRDSRIKTFLKLPDWYFVETPAGKYISDWAVLVEKKTGDSTANRIYFVVETKGTTDIGKLRPDEQMKIRSARKRFEKLAEVKFLAPIDKFSTFEERW